MASTWNVKAEGGNAGRAPDLAETRQALALLVDPASTAELFSLFPARYSWMAGAEVDGLAAEVGEHQGSVGNFVALNPLPADYLGQPGAGAHVPDFAGRRWLPLDVDPVKPAKDVNATDAEHAAARDVMGAAVAFLAGKGAPDPLVIDTGGGWLALYRVDLPNDADARALVARFLKRLGGAFDAPGAKVDADAAKVTFHARLPGTWNRKGLHGADRPQRMVRLARVPATLGVLPRALLEELAGPAPEGRERKPFRTTATGSEREKNYARKALDGECRAVAAAAVGTRNKTLNEAALKVGHYVGSGMLAREEAERELLAAALVCGLDEREARATIKSGLDAGEKEPRGMPEETGPVPSTNGYHPKAAPPVETPLPLSWPDPPLAAAYHGLAGEIVRLIEPQTEADPFAILLQMLVMFGNACGRFAHWRVENDSHFGNLFCCLVGPTGTGRKGTSQGRALQTFGALGDDWARKRILGGLSSGEGVVKEVRDERWERHAIKEQGRVVDYEDVMVDAGVVDKRLLVVEPEFGRVLQVLRREGSILSPLLRLSWDNGNLRIMTKSGQQATGAHVSLIAHVTRQELRVLFPGVEGANGFGNRFLWAAVRRSKLLPLGGNPVELGGHARKLAAAVEQAQLTGLVPFDAGAAAFWRDEVYSCLEANVPGLLGALTTRASAQVRRLALLYALLDSSSVVGLPHLMAALAVWDYCQRSCRWIFGDSTGDPIADEILAGLRAAGDDGLALDQIRNLFARHCPSTRIAEALDVLRNSELAFSKEVATGGRPATRWFLLRPKR